MNQLILSRAYLMREAVVLTVIGIASFFVFPQKDAIAFLAGYGLFLLDLLAIAYLSAAMIAATKEQPILSKGSLAGLFFLKLTLLVAALYFVLVGFRLSGLHFAAGALLALLGVSLHWAVTYMKSRVAS